MDTDGSGNDDSVQQIRGTGCIDLKVIDHIAVFATVRLLSIVAAIGEQVVIGNRCRI